MTVTTSGFPKSGNHALVKAVQLLGVPCQVDHRPYADGVPAGKHIYIKRHPRNVLVSWLRFGGQPVTQGMMITVMADFQRKTFADSLAEYEGWLTDPNTLVIRYEDLIASDAVLRQIAGYLGVNYLDDAYPNLEGATMSYTPVHSDWTTVWSPEVDAAWLGHGLDAVQARWGY